MIKPFPSMLNLNFNLPTSTWHAWTVCISASMYFFYEFLLTNMFNAIGLDLTKTFALSAIDLGRLSAYYFYGQLLFLMIAGVILDLISTKRLILSAMLVCIVSTYIFATANALWILKLSRFLSGAAATFSLLSCIRLASRWFPPTRMALLIGVTVTIAFLGGILAQTPLTYLTDLIGWRKALLVVTFIGVLLFFQVMAFVQDHPSQSTNHDGKIFLKTISFWPALLQVLSQLQNWLAGLYTGLLNLPVFLLGAIWGILYLVQAHNLTRIEASYVTSMIFVGTIIGSPIIGWLSDTIGRRKLPMVLCSAISLLIILIIMYVHHLTFITLLSLFFALGFFTSAQIISYPLTAESNSLSLTGSAEGLVTTLVMAGGLSQTLFGYLMDLNWDHKIINKVPIYSIQNYQNAMLIILVAFIVGFIASLFIKETYCQNIKKISGL